MDPIYLDYNATTPVDSQVAEAMLPYIHQHYGNPSSSHIFGMAAKGAVEKARNQLAKMLRSQADEVIFTSGGTESINYAIKGVAGAYRHKGNHIITSSVEHPAALEVCRYLEQRGCRVTYLPVDEFGIVDPQQVEDAVTGETILISIMHANNEVGTIEPIEDIVEIARRRGVLLHADWMNWA
jgi:cysteine sulfinate desulfinase/cysteine desulfurase-like protein